MLVAHENNRLCRVKGEASMSLMRRQWILAVLSEQVAEPDGTPIRLRVLGKDLVAFCDTDGCLGLLGDDDLQNRAVMKAGDSAGLPGIPNHGILPKIQNWRLLGVVDEDLPGLEEDPTDRKVAAAE